MRTWNIKICLVFLCLSSIAIAEPMPAVFIAGQSNCVGRDTKAKELPSEHQVLQPNFLIMGGERTYAYGLIQPNAIGGDDRGDFGPEVGLAHYLSQRDKKSWAMVKYAEGGTGLQKDWMNGDQLLNSAIAFANAAKQNQNIDYKLFAWIQGEGDSIRQNDAAAYQANLTSLINQVRAAIGNVPVVVVRTHHFNSGHFGTPNSDGNYALWVRDAQTKVANTIENVHIVTTDDLPLPDGIHYSSAGCWTLGQRIGLAFDKSKDVLKQAEMAGNFNTPPIPTPVPLPDSPPPPPPPGQTLKSDGIYADILAYYVGSNELKASYPITLYGATLENNKLNFDGLDDYAISQPPSFDSNQSFSIIASVELTGTPMATTGHHIVWSLTANDQSPRCFIRYIPDTSTLQLQVISDNGAISTVSAVAPLISGTVAGVVDRGDQKLYLYLNGALLAEQALTANTDGFTVANSMYLGALINDVQPVGKFALKGSINSLSLWNRSLSTAEVLSLYNDPNQVFLP